MKDLIKQLREGFQHGDSANVLEAIKALERQSAEIEQLKVSKKLLEGAFDNKADELIKAIAERDALQAKLSAMEKQEPIGEVSGNDWSSAILYRDLERGSAVYAAPKVVQPQAQGEDKLRETVATVLEGWTIPDAVRKMLETAYWSYPQASEPAAPEATK